MDGYLKVYLNFYLSALRKVTSKFTSELPQRTSKLPVMRIIRICGRNVSPRC